MFMGVGFLKGTAPEGFAAQSRTKRFSDSLLFVHISKEPWSELAVIVDLRCEVDLTGPAAKIYDETVPRDPRTCTEDVVEKGEAEDGSMGVGAGGGSDGGFSCFTSPTITRRSRPVSCGSRIMARSLSGTSAEGIVTVDASSRRTTLTLTPRCFKQSALSQVAKTNRKPLKTFFSTSVFVSSHVFGGFSATQAAGSIGRSDAHHVLKSGGHVEKFYDAYDFDHKLVDRDVGLRCHQHWQSQPHGDLRLKCRLAAFRAAFDDFDCRGAAGDRGSKGGEVLRNASTRLLKALDCIHDEQIVGMRPLPLALEV
ncbi:hypothetical protein K491DRAFT_738922 [Lophiostoma macrostomum CBS 122681]|uniref:Uncharacterized protein n=1 Tax=Lophiostoma macrostomum CBS 122681 TaxID=1314788 RepID=A0A6A6TH49_9PLEO|nr:hypothetical protein K491DRAFT_738922 [Lophiostoma macrostomum CBS 122681]